MPLSPPHSSVQTVTVDQYGAYSQNGKSGRLRRTRWRSYRSRRVAASTPSGTRVAVSPANRPLCGRFRLGSAGTAAPCRRHQRLVLYGPRPGRRNPCRAATSRSTRQRSRSLRKPSRARAPTGTRNDRIGQIFMNLVLRRRYSAACIRKLLRQRARATFVARWRVLPVAQLMEAAPHVRKPPTIVRRWPFATCQGARTKRALEPAADVSGHALVNEFRT